MITYTFDQRFVPLIKEGLVLQSFRAPRLRHARPGEILSLQDPHFCTILPDAICRDVTPCEIGWHGNRIANIRVGGVPMARLDRFAVAEGFEDQADMSAWMRTKHGARYIEGSLITWSLSAGALVRQLEVA